jgi:hypothetical protein
MTNKLKQHSHSVEDDEVADDVPDMIDPRWEGLKNIQIEEDN